MKKQIDFYYDYGSPAAYLAWTQLPGLAERTGVEIVSKPVLLGGIFKGTDNRSPMSVDSKGEWMAGDLPMFAKFYGVPFRMNPYFIVNSLSIMRGAVIAAREDVLERYDEAMFQAMWVEGRNLGEADEVAAVLRGAGLDVAPFIMGVREQWVKQALIDATEAAVGRGVFGLPSFFIGDDMFFGQDRLTFVEKALGGQ